MATIVTTNESCKTYFTASTMKAWDIELSHHLTDSAENCNVRAELYLLPGGGDDPVTARVVITDYIVGRSTVFNPRVEGLSGISAMWESLADAIGRGLVPVNSDPVQRMFRRRNGR